MENIHVLPTIKPSKIGQYIFDKFFHFNPFFYELENESVIPQHIYITSDEEIKEGDWFIRDGSIHKCFRLHKTDVEFLTSIDSVYCGSNTFWSKEFCKKIILTTDQDLIKDGVQSIEDDFLEWFVILGDKSALLEGDFFGNFKLNKEIDSQIYSEIEHLIIQWNIDGTKTAGSLTREIIKLIKKTR